MNYQELPVQMHPKYQEFLAFVYGLKTDARKNPNALELAFNVWINTTLQNDNEQMQALKRDLDRKHRECAELQKQCLVMSSENERLHDELTRIKSAIAECLL